jgi:hypothetical protein
VADIILDRYRAAAADRAAQSIVARAQLTGTHACDPPVRNGLHGGKPTWNGCTAHAAPHIISNAVGFVRSGGGPC